jgi:hypothetical protein
MDRYARAERHPVHEASRQHRFGTSAPHAEERFLDPATGAKQIGGAVTFELRGASAGFNDAAIGIEDCETPGRNAPTRPHADGAGAFQTSEEALGVLSRVALCVRCSESQARMLASERLGSVPSPPLRSARRPRRLLLPALGALLSTRLLMRGAVVRG